MPADFQAYQQNKMEIAQEIAHLREVMNRNIPQSILPNVPPEEVMKLEEIREALAFLDEDIKDQREFPDHKTDEKEAEKHLNALNHIPAILSLSAEGRTYEESVLLSGERKWLYGALNRIDEATGIEISPQGPGANYGDYMKDANALRNIDALKERLYDEDRPDRMGIREKREFIAAVFASRMTVKSKMGKASSLDKEMDEATFHQNYRKLLKNRNFNKFADSVRLSELKEAMTGHGGDLEKKYREYNLQQLDIPAGVPKRYAPTALQKIEYLQQTLKKPGLSDVVRKQVITEILACRIAVNAVQGDKKSLQQPLSPKAFAEAKEMLNSNKTFQEITSDPAHLIGLQKACLTFRGHGGAAERYVQRFTSAAEPINNNNPTWLSPHFQTPQSFKDVQTALNNGVGSNNPHVQQRLLAAGFYFAGTENHPDLNPLENMEDRIDQIQESDTFQYMLEHQGTQQMSEALKMGAGTALDRFATSQTIMETKEAMGNAQPHLGNNGMEQGGPQQNGPAVGPQ